MNKLVRAASRYLGEVRRATALKSRAHDLREELVLWDFRDRETLQQWVCLCDEDVHGYSRAQLELNGKGVSYMTS